MAGKRKYLLGRKAVCYFNAAEHLLGDVGDPGSTKSEFTLAWLADEDTKVAGNIAGVTLNIESEYADGTTRETAEDGFASQIPVLRGGSVTFEALWEPEDPAATTLPFFKVLMNAWKTDSPVGLVFLDQSIVAPSAAAGETAKRVQGLAANFNVSISKAEELRDLQRTSVSVTIADSGQWYEQTINSA